MTYSFVNNALKLMWGAALCPKIYTLKLLPKKIPKIYALKLLPKKIRHAIIFKSKGLTDVLTGHCKVKAHP